MCFMRNKSRLSEKKYQRLFEGKKYYRDEIQPSILCIVKVSDVITIVLSSILYRCIISGDSNMAPKYRPI